MTRSGGFSPPPLAGSGGFAPPPYPYDRLNALKPLAEHHAGGLVDLSIGTPVDEPPAAAIEALGSSGAERGYPPSIGTEQLRQSAANWLNQRLGVHIDADTQLAATVGTKEFVAGAPHWLRLRTPERDTVLYPAVSYPSYAMGATLGGCRAVPVPCDEQWRLRLDAIDPHDAERALMLWVNTPGNPAGALDDLEAAAAWGRANEVPVFSDECYAEFTWNGPPRTVLDTAAPSSPTGTTTSEAPPPHDGVVALHSISKRSNLAGVRVGFYAGDSRLVDYLREVRKHAGFMVPAPAQAAATAALADQSHVDDQRDRYLRRLEGLAEVLGRFGAHAQLPEGGFYLWVAAPEGDAWAFTRLLAAELGALVAPGEFYGESGSAHVRVAAVCTDSQLDLLRERAGIG